MRSSISQIAEDFRRLGLQKGDAVFTHSSMRSLGPVEGGCEAVLQAMEEVVGADGTLLFPAFSFGVTEPPRVFSYEATPCCVGALPEYFRTRPGTLRSVHPTHSVSAKGLRARELTRDHILDATPVGPRSPLALLPKIGGKILMLGCGMAPNTSMHGVEELAEAPYPLSPNAVEYTLDLGNGDIRKVLHRPHAFGSRWIQRYERLEALLPDTALRRGTVLNADCFLMDAAAVWDIACRKMREEPYFFVDDAEKALK